MTVPPEAQLKWSAQFTVSQSDRSRTLPGDKINLPPAALERLLAASSNAAAENARRDLPAYDPYSSATYSAYRQAESQYQDQRQQLPYPLTFRLVNPSNGRVVYAGIREFSAEDEEAELSAFLWESLGLNDSHKDDGDKMDVDLSGHHGVENMAKVTVRAEQLPKGTFVKLRPLEAGYDVEDWKALLEQHLRQNYTTLTNGEVLIVQNGRGTGGKRQDFKFLVDGFKPESEGICVVDTDLEVDIEALNEEQARETLKRIAQKVTKAPGTEQGSSSGGELDIFNVQQGQVLPGEYVDYRLSSWDRTQALELELSCGDEDKDSVDLLISPFSSTQRSKPRLDEYVFADLEGRATKRIRLESSNVELEHAEALFVSIHAYSFTELHADDHTNGSVVDTSPKTFTLRAHHPHPDAKSMDISSDQPNTALNADDIQCKNCHQWVPKRTLILHENFCLRNNLLCPHGCGQVFQKRSTDFESHWHCPHDSSYGNNITSRQRHDNLFHPPEVFRCTDCGTKETFSTIPLLAHHRTTTCPAKLILCRFCHLVVPQEGDPDGPNAEALLSGMTPHELADGSRTTECHMCSKIVRLRDMAAHLRNHDLDRLSRPPPIPCRNVYCSRTLDVCAHSGDTRAGTRMGQGPGNDIGLCSVCFGPLYVSMYDPENKALKRRVERRYLQQLLTGCGKSWCQNEFCKAGRKGLDLSTNITTKDALPMVKPYMEELLGNQKSALHFCVDEKNQRRRKLAEMLAAEDGRPVLTKGYELNWCIGAVEAENGDLDGARQWLKNWAPTRQEESRR